MNYLERLKHIERQKVFAGIPEPEPPELTKGASGGFGSAGLGIHANSLPTSLACVQTGRDKSAVQNPAFAMATTCKASTDAECWQEFERLLAIVGPAYRTPEHAYTEMRKCARGDLANALTCYQSMAEQIAHSAGDAVARDAGAAFNSLDG